MSSASIVRGVAARIKMLVREPTESQQFLLREMETIIQLLNAADLLTKKSRQFVRLEKLLVQLCYDIADVVDLWILPKPKPIFPKLFRLNSISYSSRAQPDLDTRTLTSMRSLLEYVVENIPYSSSHHDVYGSRDEDAAAVVAGAVAAEWEVKEGLRGPDSVVCIYGDSGMGKTTLAKKVLNDARDGGYFEGFAWVQLDQECQPRKVFEQILQELSPAKKRADIRGMDEIEMIQQILIIQKEKRCLIVLDDIWSVSDWDNIRSALLVSSTSRTLITTSSIQVAEMVKSKARLCHMQALNKAEICSLLKEKANFDDHDVQVYGKNISTLSQGSPLFAVTLGKSFKTADEVAMHELVGALDTYRDRISQGENQVFDVCYDILANELKPCWIYMGQFPEGQDIEVEKLHLLLEAEGFMPPVDDGASWNNQTRQHSITNILQKLARRKLVKLQEDKASMTTMYKSCQLHQLIRSFCISKGREKELFEIVQVENGRQAINVAPSARRLAIYLSEHKDHHAVTFTTQNTANKIRSILIFDTLGSATPSKINGLKQFSNLRVLNFHRVDFRVRKQVLRGMHKLVLLRYLSFVGCWLEAFPSSISKFLMLETLDLRVHNDCTMIMPNSFPNMKRLRNLYFPLSYKTQNGAKLRLCGLEKLEILIHFNTEVCDVNDLSQLTALQILTTISEENHGDLAAIIDSNLQQTSFIIRNFNCYSADMATVLKRLLECESLRSLQIQGRIYRFPEGVAISPNLSEVVFDGSEIEDDPMKVLRTFNNLRSIVLSNNAFVGEKKSIVFSRKQFLNLRSLKLLNLRNLSLLIFHIGSVPMLSTLVVDKCAELDRVSMPKTLHNWLQAVQRKKGDDDVYSVEITPTMISDYN